MQRRYEVLAEYVSQADKAAAVRCKARHLLKAADDASIVKHMRRVYPKLVSLRVTHEDGQECYARDLRV